MHRSLTFLLATCSISVCAATTVDSFETTYAKAQANALTERGAAYDTELGTAFENMPEFRAKVTNCLEANPGPHSVRGYFLFLSPKDFQVVLEPRDSFSFCLSQALASPSLPAPPEVPYLNPFTFSTQP